MRNMFVMLMIGIFLGVVYLANGWGICLFTSGFAICSAIYEMSLSNWWAR